MQREILILKALCWGKWDTFSLAAATLSSTPVLRLQTCKCEVHEIFLHMRCHLVHDVCSNGSEGVHHGTNRRLQRCLQWIACLVISWPIFSFLCTRRRFHFLTWKYLGSMTQSGQRVSKMGGLFFNVDKRVERWYKQEWGEGVGEGGIDDRERGGGHGLEGEEFSFAWWRVQAFAFHLRLF